MLTRDASFQLQTGRAILSLRSLARKDFWSRCADRASIAWLRPARAPDLLRARDSISSNRSVPRGHRYPAVDLRRRCQRLPGGRIHDASNGTDWPARNGHAAGQLRRLRPGSAAGRHHRQHPRWATEDHWPGAADQRPPPPGRVAAETDRSRGRNHLRCQCADRYPKPGPHGGAAATEVRPGHRGLWRRTEGGGRPGSCAVGLRAGGRTRPLCGPEQHPRPAGCRHPDRGGGQGGGRQVGRGACLAGYAQGWRCTRCRLSRYRGIVTARPTSKSVRGQHPVSPQPRQRGACRGEAVTHRRLQRPARLSGGGQERTAEERAGRCPRPGSAYAVPSDSRRNGLSPPRHQCLGSDRGAREPGLCSKWRGHAVGVVSTAPGTGASGAPC